MPLFVALGAEIVVGIICARPFGRFYFSLALVPTLPMPSASASHVLDTATVAPFTALLTIELER